MATGQGHEVTSGRADATSAGSSGEIRQEIRRTRAEMDETVDALSEKLRPRHLLDDMLDMFRNKAGGTDAEVKQNAMEYGSAAIDRLKNNPMPAALIGAGIAWLIFDQTRESRGGTSGRGGNGNGPYGRWRDEDLREHSGSFVDARTGEPYDNSYGSEFRGSEAHGRAGGSAQGGGSLGTGSGTTAGSGGGPGMVEKLKDKAGQIGESIAGAASSAADSIRGSASGAASAMSGAADRAGDWSGSAYRGAGDGLHRGYQSTRRGFEDALDRYPLAMGAAALAAGVLTGLLLPETRRENELMGEQADRLKEGAKDTAQDLMQRGKDVAGAAANAVAGEAQQQGVAPGSLAEKVKHVAQDVAQAARESARREGLDDLGQKAASTLNAGKEAAKEEGRRQGGGMTS